MFNIETLFSTNCIYKNNLCLLEVKLTLIAIRNRLVPNWRMFAKRHTVSVYFLIAIKFGEYLNILYIIRDVKTPNNNMWCKLNRELSLNLLCGEMWHLIWLLRGRLSLGCSTFVTTGMLDVNSPFANKFGKCSACCVFFVVKIHVLNRRAYFWINCIEKQVLQTKQIV